MFCFFLGKIIYVLNKNEYVFDMVEFLYDINGDVDGFVVDCVIMKKRINVLFFGDYFGDLGMFDGLNY